MEAGGGEKTWRGGGGEEEDWFVYVRSMTRAVGKTERNERRSEVEIRRANKSTTWARDMEAGKMKGEKEEKEEEEEVDNRDV